MRTAFLLVAACRLYAQPTGGAPLLHQVADTLCTATSLHLEIATERELQSENTHSWNHTREALAISDGVNLWRATPDTREFIQRPASSSKSGVESYTQTFWIAPQRKLVLKSESNSRGHQFPNQLHVETASRPFPGASSSSPRSRYRPYLPQRQNHHSGLLGHLLRTLPRQDARPRQTPRRTQTARCRSDRNQRR